MSDIKSRVETLERQAAECELISSLATDHKVRDANRRVAHDLREEAFMLRKHLQIQPGLQRHLRHHPRRTFCRTTDRA